MSQPHPRPGMYAWDESDSGSIASHTDSYRSNLFLPAREAAPAERQSRAGFAPARVASAVIARLRSRPRIEGCGG